MTKQYGHPMPPLDVAMNRAGQLRHFGAQADGEQKKMVVLADEIERLRVLVDAAKPIIGKFARDNPKWTHPERGEQDPYGVHAWLAGNAAAFAVEPSAEVTRLPVAGSRMTRLSDISDSLVRELRRQGMETMQAVFDGMKVRVEPWRDPAESPKCTFMDGCKYEPKCVRACQGPPPL